MLRRGQKLAFFILSALALLPHSAAAAPPAGSAIDNIAQLNFDSSGFSLVVLSNTVTVTAAPATTSGAVEVLRFAANPAGTVLPATAYSDNGTGSGLFIPILPTPGPGDLTPATIFSGNERVVLRLLDADRNIDALVPDTVTLTIRSTLTGDFESLRLTETGPDTGIFIGSLFLSTTAPIILDGQLRSAPDDTLIVDYLDPINGDGASDTALVDPHGIVFDGLTGTPIDGAEVVLIDNATGLEATTVVGDDGSPFPGRLNTGSSFTVGSVTYNLPPGGYRFPFIPPGDYSLQVNPPTDYSFPSTNPAPSGAYVVRTPDSYGGLFPVGPGPAIQIDVPIDPTAAGTSLWVQKNVARSSVAVGDTLEYSISVTNTDTAPIPAVTVNDRLPFGFAFRAKSARSDAGAPLTPTLSADGRTLTFTIGDLESGATVTLRYAVAVGAGARPGRAVNTARAASATLSDLVSNEGRASVEVVEDFFRSQTFLAGRVFDGNCAADETTLSGLGGIRLFLEDGSNVVTDETGRYHFVSIRPGTHVVQLDTTSLPDGYEVLDCENDSRSAGRADSRFVNLQPGSLWRSDFHVAPRPINGEVTIALDNAFAAGSAATYTINLSGKGIALQNRRLRVVLPVAAEYLPGSAELTERALSDPQQDRTSLVFHLPDCSGDWQETVRFRALIDSNAETAEMPASARLNFDTPGKLDLGTPDAESSLVWISRSERLEIMELMLQPNFAPLDAQLNSDDNRALNQVVAQLQDLDVIKVIVVGHTDARRILWREGIPYHDNVELSIARAETVARALEATLPISGEQIVVRGMADAEPMASNATAEGRAQNRRTDLRILHRVIVDPTLDRIASAGGPTRTLSTSMLPLPTTAEATAPLPGILYPLDGSRLAHPITAIGARLDKLLQPRLLLDGRPVPAGQIGATQADNDSGLTVYTYIGVDLGAPGPHTLVLQGIDPFGNVRFEETVNLLRIGGIARIVVADAGGNSADGRTPVQVRLQAFDAQGTALATPFTVEIQEGDLRPWRESIDAFDQPESAWTVDVGSDGIARFQPVTASGRYRSSLNFAGQTIDLVVDVGSEQREEWILVGLAEGTAGYSTLSGNMEALQRGVEEDLYSDGRIAFYAKGRVQGKWLLTAAYDSGRPNADGRRLHDAIDPDRYYLLYGDASVQRNDASSSRKLFLKIERGLFSTLFGDFDTGLTVTELTRYSRSLTGIKTEWHGDHGDLVAFASDTGQAFVRDEIQGDGTSGLYRLSHGVIVENSDKLVLEIRDRFRSEVVLSSRPLTRHVDYDLDPYNGTLFFKAPVLSRDQDFNPVFIVIDYEVPHGSDRLLTYGGRAATPLGPGSELGVSFVHEDLGDRQGNLYGSDFRLTLTDATTLRAELAATDNQENGLNDSAIAWMAELQHESTRFNGQLWWREQQSGFGLGQLSSGETATRKFGGQGNYRLTDQVALEALATHEKRLDTDAWRNVAESAVTVQQTKSNLRFGARRAVDRLSDGRRLASNQIFTGGSWQPLQRLTLQARHEQTIGVNKNVDFPTRTLLGAEVRLFQPLSIYGEQEFAHSDSGDSNSSRLGLRSNPWQGGRIDSAVQRTTGEDNTRLLALFGLQQAWKVDNWILDLSLDRAQTLSNRNDRFNPAVPAASGDDDFTAISLGGSTEGENWKWWNRAEYRGADTEDRWGLTSGIACRLRPGVGLGARTALFRTERESGDSADLQVSFSGVWRPDDSRWILLDRIDARSQQTAGSGGTRSGRVVNNLHANYKPNRTLQLAFQYGAKYVVEELLDLRFAGYTDLLGLEIRRDLGRKWDIGLHGGALHSWEIGQLDWRSGASVGFNPAENLWVSLGYNLTGFSDDDFAQGNYTAQGPYLNLRFKFDQNSVKDALIWLDRG